MIFQAKTQDEILSIECGPWSWFIAGGRIVAWFRIVAGGGFEAGSRLVASYIIVLWICSFILWVSILQRGDLIACWTLVASLGDLIVVFWVRSPRVRVIFGVLGPNSIEKFWLEKSLEFWLEIPSTKEMFTNW